MILQRIQGGSFDGIDTHCTTYFQYIWKSLHRHITIPLKTVADPFARNCDFAHPWTNDIDETTTARHHLDAQVFLSSICASNHFDLVIFDPPFSQSQEKKYAGHKNVYATPHYVPSLMTEIYRCLKPGGYLLKFGFNTTRHKEGFQWVHGWVANMGGNRNDVLISLWKKINTSLEDFE